MFYFCYAAVVDGDLIFFMVNLDWFNVVGGTTFGYFMHGRDLMKKREVVL